MPPICVLRLCIELILDLFGCDFGGGDERFRYLRERGEQARSSFLFALCWTRLNRAAATRGSWKFGWIYNRRGRFPPNTIIQISKTAFKRFVGHDQITFLERFEQQ